MIETHFSRKRRIWNQTVTIASGDSSFTPFVIGTPFAGVLWLIEAASVMSGLTISKPGSSLAVGQTPNRFWLDITQSDKSTEGAGAFTEGFVQGATLPITCPIAVAAGEGAQAIVGLRNDTAIAQAPELFVLVQYLEVTIDNTVPPQDQLLPEAFRATLNV